MIKTANYHKDLHNFVYIAADFYNSRIMKNKGGLIVIAKEASGLQVLVVSQTNTYVGFPKGTMDKFETYKTTAEREFTEETGIHISDIKNRSTYVGEITQDKHHMHIYILNEDSKPSDFEINPKTKEEIMAAFWMDLEVLKNLPTGGDSTRKKSFTTHKIINKLELKLKELGYI